jgi:signal transduction histidine kinase
LTPILFVSSVLGQDPTVPDHIREELNIIARNAGLEARLIDDLLDVTRIGQGKLSLTFETVDAHELLHSALGICSNEISAENLRVQVKLEATGHRIRADAARLQQVFWNLIKTARRSDLRVQRRRESWRNVCYRAPERSSKFC